MLRLISLTLFVDSTALYFFSSGDLKIAADEVANGTTQTGVVAKSGIMDPGPPSPELQAVLPIAWVHVPKCGSSFLNTIVHLPGVCPGFSESLIIGRKDFGGRFLDVFTRRYDIASECPGILFTNFGHGGIETFPGYPQGKGHFMTMLRGPKQRLLAAYKDLEGAWMFESREEVKNRVRSWGGWPNVAKKPTPREFALRQRGCATRMLTRPEFPCGGSGGMPTSWEMAQAKRRLREGFSFVGLTDRWQMSMCLFSFMFRVDCRASQFKDTRPGADKSVGHAKHDISVLDGVEDPYDSELYAEAVRIFEENLRKYKVTEESCAQCWSQAGVLPPAMMGSAEMFEDEVLEDGVL